MVLYRERWKGFYPPQPLAVMFVGQSEQPAA